MFGSPFDFCPVCNECVLLDQTQKECARERECGIPESKCPLKKFFVGIEFGAETKQPDDEHKA